MRLFRRVAPRGEGSLSVLVCSVSISEHDSGDRRVKARWVCCTELEFIHDERRVAGLLIIDIDERSTPVGPPHANCR